MKTREQMIDAAKAFSCDVTITDDLADFALAQIADTERRLDDLDRWRLALESLTPQGSEFVNDLDACMAYIEKRRQSDHETLKKALREKKELERRLAIAVEALEWLEEFVDDEDKSRGTLWQVIYTALAQIRGEEEVKG